MWRGGSTRDIRLDSGAKVSPNDTLIVRFKVTHLQSVSLGEAGVGSGHFPGSRGEIMGCLPKRTVSSEWRVIWLSRLFTGVLV